MYITGKQGGYILEKLYPNQKSKRPYADLDLENVCLDM
jgi:hypothetical protein